MLEVLGWAVLVAVSWTGLSLGAALIVGRSIRLADKRMEIPSHWDPAPHRNGRPHSVSTAPDQHKHDQGRAADA